MWAESVHCTLYKYVCDLVVNVLFGQWNVAIVKDEKCVEGMFKNARIQSLMGTQQELIVASHWKSCPD